MRIVKAVAVWLLILVLAILNGALREAVLVPALGRALALPISGILLCVVVILVARLLATYLGVTSVKRALWIGALWTGLTVAFEFGFGRLVLQQTWEHILGAYRFEGGNLWPLVLVSIFLAPLTGIRRDHRPD